MLLVHQDRMQSLSCPVLLFMFLAGCCGGAGGRGDVTGLRQVGIGVTCLSDSMQSCSCYVII